MLTLSAILAAPCLVNTSPEKAKTTDPGDILCDVVQCFTDPVPLLDKFVVMPVVLYRPVKDISDKCDKIGLVPFGEQVALSVLLAELVYVDQDLYRPYLIEWIQLHEQQIPQVRKWTAARGLSIKDYLEHLHAEGTADGLEVWLASLAAIAPVNIVQEDHVWGSWRDGIDFSQPTCVDRIWSSSSVPSRAGFCC